MKFDFVNISNMELTLALANNNVPCKVTFNGDVATITPCGWGDADMMFKAGLSKKEIIDAVKEVRWS